MAEKIGYKNWLSSARKWVKIVIKVQWEEKFASDRGFKELLVVTSCGYCEEFATCDSCSLFLKRVESCLVCFDKLRFKTHFTCFVDEMQTEEPNFEIALRHAEVILNAILEDCPDKDRAIQDGIVFE
ncbi:MAG: hypothetical protein KAV41_00400 [Candidatus Pacebacteria bacterium]|nr:hypothetical protein [Candidatus Paceibacterota bacterium]